MLRVFQKYTLPGLRHIVSHRVSDVRATNRRDFSRLSPWTGVALAVGQGAALSAAPGGGGGTTSHVLRSKCEPLVRWGVSFCKKPVTLPSRHRLPIELRELTAARLSFFFIQLRNTFGHETILELLFGAFQANFANIPQPTNRNFVQRCENLQRLCGAVQKCAYVA